MVYGVQDPNAMYNKYGINGFYNQYGLYNNNQSPSIFGNGYNQGNGDDGKISFGEKVGSFFKGIGKSIVNGVKSIFTPKGLLKTALTVGACMIPGIGPVIGMGLAVAGVAKGATTVLKGAAQASAATTDAEAKAAWENIGGGAFTTAASVAGVKGAAKAIKNVNTSAGATPLQSVKDATGLYNKAKVAYGNAKTTLKNAKTKFDGTGLGKSVTRVKDAYKSGDKLTTKLGNVKEQLKTEANTGYEALKTAKGKYTEAKAARLEAKNAKASLKNADKDGAVDIDANLKAATELRKDIETQMNSKIKEIKSSDKTSKAKSEAIKAYKKEVNETIENLSKDLTLAEKYALRGETTLAKNAAGAFSRAATQAQWASPKDAATVLVANQLEEANSEYEMYNQYLQSVANSNTGYSA